MKTNNNDQAVGAKESQSQNGNADNSAASCGYAFAARNLIDGLRKKVTNDQFADSVLQVFYDNKAVERFPFEGWFATLAINEEIIADSSVCIDKKDTVPELTEQFIESVHKYFNEQQCVPL